MTAGNVFRRLESCLSANRVPRIVALLRLVARLDWTYHAGTRCHVQSTTEREQAVAPSLARSTSIDRKLIGSSNNQVWFSTTEWKTVGSGTAAASVSISDTTAPLVGAMPLRIVTAHLPFGPHAVTRVRSEDADSRWPPHPARLRIGRVAGVVARLGI